MTKLSVNQINEFVLSLKALDYTKAEALEIIEDAETRAQFCVENATDYNDAVEILNHSLQYDSYIVNGDMLDVCENIIWLLMPY
jgi:hypothetical protein